MQAGFVMQLSLGKLRGPHSEAGAGLAQHDGEEVAAAGGRAQRVAAVAVALLVQVAPARAEARPQRGALRQEAFLRPGSNSCNASCRPGAWPLVVLIPVVTYCTLPRSRTYHFVTAPSSACMATAAIFRERVHCLAPYALQGRRMRNTFRGEGEHSMPLRHTPAFRWWPARWTAGRRAAR